MSVRLGRARIVVAAMVTATVLGGCVMHEASARVGQLTPDGGLVVGAGELGGVQWDAVGRARGDELCIDWTVMLPDELEPGCAVPDAEEAISRVVVVGGGDDSSWTLVEGLAGDRVIWIQLQTPALVTEVRAVTLGNLGLPGRAFAAAFAPGTVLLAVHAFDVDGYLLEEMAFEAAPSP